MTAESSKNSDSPWQQADNYLPGYFCLALTRATPTDTLIQALKERESPYGGGGHLQEDDLEGWRSAGQIAESLFE